MTALLVPDPAFERQLYRRPFLVSVKPRCETELSELSELGAQVYDLLHIPRRPGAAHMILFTDLEKALDRNLFDILRALAELRAHIL